MKPNLFKKQARPLALVLLAALALAITLAGCGGAPPAAAGGFDPSTPEPETSSQPQSSSTPASSSLPTPEESSSIPEDTYTPKEEDIVKAEITLTDGGVIKLDLDKGAAPLTVENFVKLAKDGFYDGTIFHRVVKGFMIQGGDPDGNGTGGPGHTIKGEFAANGWDNPISHTPGTISMARSSDPDSAGSQFFITDSLIDPGNTKNLDGSYAAFGRVTEGMDVVDAIAGLATKHNEYSGEKSVPIEPAKIESVKIIEDAE